MKQLPKDLFRRYLEDPYRYDAEVRNFACIPEDKYYTVSVWPESVAGQVRLNGLTRVVKSKKISKSDQRT